MKKHPVYEIYHFDNTSHKNTLYVNTFKNHIAQHSFIEEPHRHNFHLAVLFTNGSGSHDIDFDRYEIRRGSLFMLQPGQIHNWSLSEDIEGYIIFCPPETYNLHFRNTKIEHYPFYQSVKSKPEVYLSETELLQIQPYFDLMVSESQNPGFGKESKLLNLLDIIHIEVSRKYLLESNHETHSYNHKIRQLEAFLEAFYKSEKSPSFYASKMSITLKHLNRICKNILNETVTEIITKRIVLEAKRQLNDKSKSVSQIADALGYDNYSYFGKLFKKHTGTTPNQFRNNLQ